MTKTVFKSMHNWRRYPSSNYHKIDQKRGSKFGGLLWRHLLKNIFWKIYFL